MELLEQFGIGIDWNAVQGIGTIIAAFIAWLVFLEARSIRQLHWVSQAGDKWQDFNRLLIESNLSGRWEAIRSGHPIDRPLDATDKRLLLMYFNIQMVEYHLMKRRIVPSNALAAMRSELKAFGLHRDFVNRVLVDGGYDPNYVKFIQKSLSAEG